MIMTALARLGKDAELRHTPSGEVVANLALACNYGRRGDDGNRPTQWIDASLWGKRAESLAQHLTKGKLIYVVLEEPHVETYEGKNGTGAKMVARVQNLEFAGSNEGGRSSQQPAAQPPRQAPTQNRQGAQPDSDSFSDDIPFTYIARGVAGHSI